MIRRCGAITVGSLTTLVLLLTPAGRSCAETAGTTVQLALKENWQAVAGLSGLAGELRTLMYLETVGDEAGGLASWFMLPLRNVPGTINADTPEEAVAQLALQRHILEPVTTLSSPPTGNTGRFGDGMRRQYRHASHVLLYDEGIRAPIACTTRSTSQSVVVRPKKRRCSARAVRILPTSSWLRWPRRIHLQKMLCISSRNKCGA